MLSFFFAANLFEHRVLSVPVAGEIQRRDRGVCVSVCPDGFILDEETMRSCVSCNGPCPTGMAKGNYQSSYITCILNFFFNFDRTKIIIFSG